MLVAALPEAGPPCPIKIWSTMLYSAVTSIEDQCGGMAKADKLSPPFS